jgi:hypothetical protein
MEGYIDYINSSLPDDKGNRLLYKYKKKVLDEMTTRADEIASRGISDSKVINDLVISEYSELDEKFKEYYAKETASQKLRRGIILNAIGSAIYLILIVSGFLAVSFITKRWDMTWAIVVDGVLLWVAYLLMLGVNKFASMKKIFHIFARLLLIF